MPLDLTAVIIAILRPNDLGPKLLRQSYMVMQEPTVLHTYAYGAALECKLFPVYFWISMRGISGLTIAEVQDRGFDSMRLLLRGIVHEHPVCLLQPKHKPVILIEHHNCFYVPQTLFVFYRSRTVGNCAAEVDARSGPL